MKICPKCQRPYGGKVKRSKHHVLPRRVRHSNETVEICRDCHDSLEELIQTAERKLLYEHKSMYQQVLEEFLRG